MMRIAAVAMLLVALAAGLAHAGGSATIVEARAAATCPSGFSAMTIDGRQRCLRSGHGCKRRFDEQYHRFGFHCHAGYLYSDAWHRLRRPLHVPKIPPGAPCPVSRVDGRIDFAAYGVGLGFGDGPAYPIFGSRSPSEGAQLRFQYPPASNSVFFGSAWGGQKVLWFVVPGGAPVLVRGRQLDGPNEVRCDAGDEPSQELLLPRAFDRPSFTRLRAPGCYAYQIDGTDFSKLIVFDALLL
ncbi:MAG: hypothetical protein H0U03_14615 [Actinobacteria bacterium]|nr:hypothetical protein [Actinomycetota bacterium]